MYVWVYAMRWFDWYFQKSLSKTFIGHKLDTLVWLTWHWWHPGCEWRPGRGPVRCLDPVITARSSSFIFMFHRLQFSQLPNSQQKCLGVCIWLKMVLCVFATSFLDMFAYSICIYHAVFIWQDKLCISIQFALQSVRGVIFSLCVCVSLFLSLFLMSLFPSLSACLSLCLSGCCVYMSLSVSLSLLKKFSWNSLYPRQTVYSLSICKVAPSCHDILTTSFFCSLFAQKNKQEKLFNPNL